MEVLRGIIMQSREALESICMAVYKYNDDESLLTPIDGLINTRNVDRPSLYKYPYEIFGYMLNLNEFGKKYTNEHFKLFIPELSVDGRLFSFNQNSSGEPETVNAPYDRYCINISSNPLKNELVTYVIDLHDSYWDRIKSLYLVSIDNTYELIATGTVFSNDLSIVAKKAMDHIEAKNDTTLFDSYTLVPVPFNRTQPVIKGEQDCTEFLLKNDNDLIDDIKISVQRIYRDFSE